MRLRRYGSFGYLGDEREVEVQPRHRYVTTRDQQAALKQLAKLTRKSLIEPHISLLRRAALAITMDCDARDDWCELEAVFNAVKYGTDKVPGLERGLRYIGDPVAFDLFTAPYRILEMCRSGSCAEDCDGHASLLAALTSAIGFQAGLNAWGRKPNEPDHVFAVVRFPKKNPKGDVVAMDTSADVGGDGVVGWHPPSGYNLIEWL